MNPNMLQSILSIHDVMPHTFKRIKQCLAELTLLDVPTNKIYLLVVPGLNWKPEQITQLKNWQQQGYQLAGHGWVHHFHKKASLYHHLHSFFISRNVAEHLSLSTSEIQDLIEDNYNWFVDNNLQAPDLYVPPAWAMGNIKLHQLSQLPFRFYELSTGIYDTHTQTFHHLPLTGYEADQFWRVPILKLWNALNLKRLSRNMPLRISIHPYDFTYRLAEDIRKHIGQKSHYLELYEIDSKKRTFRQI
ncbi:polysaccharide deacetylase family protein [Marinicellulosiphila megalodicopiae]|uniref:polysaccharide deacetylase family protein n=1 Tax=Marinicellulosiphila megalodicopiae TaxID=2724896 RepID=UPI003BB1EBE1